MPEENILEKLPLFAKFDSGECRKLAALYSQVKYYKAGERVFDQGSPGNSLHIIKQGKIKISLNLQSMGNMDESTLAVLEAGKFFGSLTFLDQEPHSAMAEALEETVLIQISQENFERFCDDNPRCGYLIIHEIGVSIANMVRETEVKIENFGSYLLG